MTVRALTLGDLDGVVALSARDARRRESFAAGPLPGYRRTCDFYES